MSQVLTDSDRAALTRAARMWALRPSLVDLIVGGFVLIVAYSFRPDLPVPLVLGLVAVGYLALAWLLTRRRV